MHIFSNLASALLLLSTTATAHMQLHYPAPFNASNNPHRTTAYDEYLQYPYDCCGPGARWQWNTCRGYMSLLGTPQGAPTAEWEAGSTQSWNVSGIGNHYGGSCQVGFSTDKGETFRVATSYEGNCPHRLNGNGPAGQNFDFKVPADTPTGVQVFAWMWYNREQEFNMNCAAVNITSTSTTASQPSGYGSPSTSTSAPGPTYTTANGCSCTCDSPTDITTCTCAGCNKDDIAQLRARDLHIHLADQLHDKKRDGAQSIRISSAAFSDRPLMLIADDGNGCLTPKTTAEVKYPDPGPDVVKGDGVYPLQLPSGKCDGSGPQAYDGH